jgi:hypothetical protein
MRNRAFSLRSGNEGERGLRQSSLAVLQIIPRQRRPAPQARFASTQTTTGQAIEPGLPRPDRPNAKTPAYKTSAHKTPARMITPAGGLYRRNAPPRWLAAQSRAYRQMQFPACNNEYIFTFNQNDACDSRIRKFQNAQPFRTLYPTDPPAAWIRSPRSPLGQTISVISRLREIRKFTALFACVGRTAGRESRPIRPLC